MKMNGIISLMKIGEKWDQGGKMLSEEWRKTIVETLEESRSARRDV